MKKAARVRYLTFSRVALEIVTKLSDEENGSFNRILFSCFQQLEQGLQPEYEPTNNPLLNVALQEAVDELQEGYKNYMQRVTARKDAENQRQTADTSPIDRRYTADASPINHRSTIEEKREEEKKEEEKRGKVEGDARGGTNFTPIEQEQLNLDVRSSGIQVDPQFWSLARKAGYQITHNALRTAKEENSTSVKYVVKMIMESMEGGEHELKA